MAFPALPHPIEITRTDLRQNQRAVLRKARGNTVLLVSGSDEGNAKVVVDREYFDEVLRKLRAMKETLEITMDEKLYGQILNVAQSVDQDIRLGKLHSFEEAFGKD